MYNTSISSNSSKISELNTSISSNSSKISELNTSISSNSSKISKLNTSIDLKQNILKIATHEFSNLKTINTRGSCSFLVLGTTSDLFGISLDRVVNLTIKYWGSASNGLWLNTDENGSIELWMYGTAGQTLGSLILYCTYF